MKNLKREVEEEDEEDPLVAVAGPSGIGAHSELRVKPAIEYYY